MKTKTTVKTLAFLACGVLTVGALALNTNTAYANEPVIPTIEMLDGASVRIPDLTTEGTYVNNGLRFTAKINKATYDSWVADGYTVTQATLIMPVEYFTANQPTAETCFTGELKYYWNTAGKGETPVYSSTVTDGMKEIINVDAPVYVAEEDTDVYTINGSIMNLEDDTLLKGNLIGISYIKKVKGETTEYIFAETDETNARNAAFVAQAALVENDKAFDDADKITAVTTDYVENYIGLYYDEYEEYPTASYTLTTYKQNSTGYAKTEVKQEVEIQSMGDFVAVTKTVGDMKIDNYGFDTDNPANDLTAILRFDGKDTMTAYYNYTGNRFTILDFEGDDPFKGGTAYANAWTMTSGDDWVGEGEGSIRHFPVNTNYANVRGVQWSTPIALPFATNTFTVEFHAGDKGFGYVDGSGAGYMESLYFRVIDGSGKEYDSSHTDETLIFEANETRIVTFTIKTEISSISKIGLIAADSVRTNTPAYLDNICAVMVDGDESKLAIEENVQEIFNGDTFTFNAQAKSYALFEDQIGSLNFVVEYKAKDAEEYTVLNGNNGAYSFSATQPIYNLKMTATFGESVVVKEFELINQSVGYKLWDFESDWTNFKPFSKHSSVSSRSTDWSANGEYSWRISDSNGLYGAYAGGDFVSLIQLENSVSKVSFWTNCTANVTLCLHIGTDQGTAEFVVRIDAGVQYNVFDLGKTVSTLKWFYIGGASPIGNFMITGSSAPDLYIDDVVFF